MPDPLLAVTRWSEAARTDIVKRDDAIRAARAGGSTLRAIAAAAGLSPQAVSNICER